MTTKQTYCRIAGVAVDMDHQHGPIVRVICDDMTTVSVYISDETAVVTLPDNKQFGMEVCGPWWEFREGLKDIVENLATEAALKEAVDDGA